MFLRNTGSADAHPFAAGVGYKLTCKISLRTFEGGSGAGIFQRLFLPALTVELCRLLKYLFLIAMFQL